MRRRVWIDALEAEFGVLGYSRRGTEWTRIRHGTRSLASLDLIRSNRQARLFLAVRSLEQSKLIEDVLPEWVGDQEYWELANDESHWLHDLLPADERAHLHIVPALDSYFPGTVERLVSAIRSHGLPWLEERGSIDRVLMRLLRAPAGRWRTVALASCIVGEENALVRALDVVQTLERDSLDGVVPEDFAGRLRVEFERRHGRAPGG